MSENETQTVKPVKKKKKKLTKAGLMLFRILLVVSIGVAAFSGWKVISGILQYKKGDNVYEQIFTEAGDTSKEAVDDNAVDFDHLKEINPEVVGWISLKDSMINYPVVQTTDNDYYLEHLFNGETNHMGTVFVDYRNKPEFQDQNTAMYAHHMRNGSMFADLEKYKNQEYYDTHKELILQTPQGNYKLEPFAGCLLSGLEDFVEMTFENDMDYLNYYSQWLSQSTFQSEVNMTPVDKMVSLITCSYDYPDARFAVFAKLTKID